MVSKKLTINIYCPKIGKDRLCWFSADIEFDKEPTQEELDYMAGAFWQDIVDNYLQSTHLWEYL